MDLTARVLELAQDLGAAGIGVCDVEPFGDVADTMADRVERGLSGSLGFTYRDPGTATDVRASYPWAHRLVVAAHPYVPAVGAPGPPVTGTGRIARFATRDHYVPLRRLLETVASTLHRAGYRAEVLVDDSRLVDRAAAVRAGVGWWGKSTLVLVPGSGPWVLLGSVVTDAPLAVSAPMKRECGTCVACLPACPTGALIEPGVLDARLCIAYWAQTPGVIPRELRSAMGDRIYGCDACLDACPPGQPVARVEAPVAAGRVDLVEVLSLDDSTLASRFSHFYIPQRRVRYLRRNVLVALGNAGDDAAVPVLAGYAGSTDWLLRAHAVWALDALLGPSARPLIDAVAASERHHAVLAEIDAVGTMP